MLAPLLVATCILLVALALLSFAKAVETDPTAVLYGAGLLALAALCAAAASWLITGGLSSAARVPAGLRRLSAAAVALAAAWGALAAGALAMWNLSVAWDDGYVWEDGAGRVEGLQPEWAGLGIACAAGAVGLLVLAGLGARFAVTGREQRPHALAQSLAACGILVAGGFFAGLVLTAAIRGDYP